MRIWAEINEKEMKETIVKVNKTKSWFEPDWSRKKREKNQINKIRNEGEVTIDNAEIQRIIRDYYEQLYGNKMVT